MIKGYDKDEKIHYGESTLIAVILCLPKVVNYKESSEFKILKSMLTDPPILRYTTSLGNKKLVDEDGNRVCGIIGIDLLPLYE